MSQKLTPIQRFWGLLKPNNRDIRNIYIYAFFTGLVGLSLPLGVQAIVNLIQSGQVSTSWIVLVTFVVLGVAFSGVLQIIQMRITENIQQDIFTRSAFEFAYRIPKIQLEELKNKYAPELVNRFFDTLTVQKGLPKLLIDFTSAILQITFGLVLLSFYHPIFILFSLILGLLIGIIMQFTARPGLETSIKESTYKYKVAYWLEEVARVTNSFKMAGKTSLPLNHTDKHVKQYLIHRDSHFKVIISQFSFLILFKVVVIAGLLGLGGYLVIEESMNIGQFIAAEIIILLIISSVDKVIQSIETIYDVLTSLEKIGQLTDLKIESTEGFLMENLDCKDGLGMALKSISHRYHNLPNYSLQNLNIDIKPGEKVVVTGPNGSGKTTLTNIISGLIKPSEGEFLIQEIPYDNLELESIRDVVGSFLEHEKIFAGSLWDNVTLGRETATVANFTWAIKNVGLNDFVNHLPHGFETELNPSNEGLSNSVIQKILLARAIVIKPQLLVVEEPLKYLDEKERNHLINFLTDSANSWTLIATSTVPYFINAAETAIHLDNGKVVSIKNNKLKTTTAC